MRELSKLIFTKDIWHDIRFKKDRRNRNPRKNNDKRQPLAISEILLSVSVGPVAISDISRDLYRFVLGRDMSV